MSNNAAMNEALAPNKTWQVAYAHVEAEARIVLDTLAPDAILSTTDLAERLYSRGEAYDAAIRKRIFKALQACAERGLARYCSRGPVRSFSGRDIRPFQWHAGRAEVIPPAKSCCPTCRRPL